MNSSNDITHLADGLEQYNTLLALCVSIGKKLETALHEISALRTELQEFKKEMYAFRDDMYTFKKETYSFRDKNCGQFELVHKNQQATFELLADMAESISDHALSKKAHKKAVELKKALL